ncbi:hypothetical protein KSZ_14930 [Dictyobacter formicarum]|uniref:Uncharacterized protein n=1 Tax=Dictyobacter formicarum TaxID=2778368 RepID=A0ABQ3VBG2_9CHLR|nr:hypothetical protein KSZ_14930 [Dictyobacter formicarum]
MLVYALEPAWADLFGYPAGQGLSGACLDWLCLYLPGHDRRWSAPAYTGQENAHLSLTDLI